MSTKRIFFYCLKKGCTTEHLVRFKKEMYYLFTVFNLRVILLNTGLLTYFLQFLALVPVTLLQTSLQQMVYP